MTETVTELKPCPFCGGEAQLATVQGGGIEWDQVECVERDCGASGPTNGKSAAESWNTRASQPVDTGVLTRMDWEVGARFVPITPPLDSEAVERVRFLQGWVERRRTELTANNGDVEVSEWLDDLEEVLSLANPQDAATRFNRLSQKEDAVADYFCTHCGCRHAPLAHVDPTEPFPFVAEGEAQEDRGAALELLRENHRTTFQAVEFRLALRRITEYYPPDTIAGRLAADALAKYPNRFEGVGVENDDEPDEVESIKGLARA